MTLQLVNDTAVVNGKITQNCYSYDQQAIPIPTPMKLELLFPFP